MRNRWGILAVLFAVRVAMSFQFQSVAAIAPLMGTQFDASLADIGLLIGLYFTPGVAISLPGGAIGLKFGDKATVLTAIFLMFAGGLAMAFSSLWAGQIAGRLIGGAGGVLLTVQMTKMVADWFAGKEIATAMAIYVVSWPAGIALSLVTLPAIGSAYGVRAVQLGVVALIVLGAVLFIATRYRPPATVVTTRAAPASARPDRRAIGAVITAGLIWGLFNVGFATIFSFGPSMLTERGWSIATAGSTVSIVMWISVIAVPFGGFAADRSGRPQALLVGAAIIAGLLMLVFARSDAVVTIAIALGLISALPAGPIMSLPARVLAPATRSIGMGIFYTVYYGAMMLGPVGAGAAKWTGNTVAAFDFGAATMLVCPVLLWCFNRIASPAAKTT